MTAATEAEIRKLLLRDDGQEDLCLAIYRPSTGRHRTTALLAAAIPPEPGDRHVHGNVTVTGDYVLRAAHAAADADAGLALLHSHPRAHRWQSMSGPDHDTEASYANLVREITGLPLVGMTLAGGDTTWSARHWTGIGSAVAASHATSVRVIGDQLKISWNDQLRPSPAVAARQRRTVSSWGLTTQADLARRHILVVGAGSVGLDVIVRLAASGITHITVMDFDVVEDHNLDRLIGAAAVDVALRRPKIHVARREAIRAATAVHPTIDASDLSICEPDGLRLALDHDLIFSCVDRPWPRAVLNALAYTDLIPVIDGGVAIDTHTDGTMRNATWRSHVIRPGRPCMSCNRQLDLGRVTIDRQGLLDDPVYIAAASSPVGPPAGQNVAPLSISAAAALLGQYISFNVAPGGIGDPGPLQYLLSTHHLEHRGDRTDPHCPIEAAVGAGDTRLDHTGPHPAAEAQRVHTRHVSSRINLLRWIDDHVVAGAGRGSRRRCRDRRPPA